LEVIGEIFENNSNLDDVIKKELKDLHERKSIEAEFPFFDFGRGQYWSK
jgi:hypothetical protein